MWAKLSSFDKSNNRQFLQLQKEKFNQTTFDPKKRTIRQFVNELQAFQQIIPALTDNDILEKTLANMPDGERWQSAKNHCLE